jgi:hypothetical protein
MSAIRTNHVCSANKIANVHERVRGSLCPSWRLSGRTPRNPSYYLNNLHPLDIVEMSLITRNSLKRDHIKKKILFPKGEVFLTLA